METPRNLHPQFELAMSPIIIIVIILIVTGIVTLRTMVVMPITIFITFI